jgi:hypothetical protein
MLMATPVLVAGIRAGPDDVKAAQLGNCWALVFFRNVVPLRPAVASRRNGAPDAGGNPITPCPVVGRMRRGTMNEDALNGSVRKFLKKVGVTSQREIEMAVREAVTSGRLKGREALPAKATVTVSGLDLTFEVEGSIELE